MKIPAQGLSQEALFEKMESYRENDVTWRDGRTWAYVYDAGPEVESVIKKAYMSFLSENALDPTVFPSLLRFENEVIAMAADHLNGDENVVGNFTSGGTESIILTVKTARDYYRKHKPEITQPEMILPVTAHAAFHKAAHYLDVKPVLVPINPEDYRADPEKMREAINENTILLVGSAISYAHGVVDPIEEIGKIALEHDLLFHVDACMGGFLLPYFRRLGGDVPPFGFEVPGVTSMSMDLHKYGFAAKGASVILHKNKDIRKHQIYACANWTGYTIINPTVQSTKSGGPLAGAWAVLNFIGDEGYMKLAKQMYDATQKIVEGIEAIDGLDLLVRPDMNLVAFTSDVADIFHVADEMNAKGWYVQPQLGYEDCPPNIHLSINPKSAQWVDDLLADLKVSLEAAKQLKQSEIVESLKDMLGSVDTATIDDSMYTQMMAMAGIEGANLPDRMAEINQLLNTLPPDFKEKMLVNFLNDLFTPAS